MAPPIRAILRIHKDDDHCLAADQSPARSPQASNTSMLQQHNMSLSCPPHMSCCANNPQMLAGCRLWLGKSACELWCCLPGPAPGQLLSVPCRSACAGHQMGSPPPPPAAQTWAHRHICGSDQSLAPAPRLMSAQGNKGRQNNVMSAGPVTTRNPTGHVGKTRRSLLLMKDVSVVKFTLAKQPTQQLLMLLL